MANDSNERQPRRQDNQDDDDSSRHSFTPLAPLPIRTARPLQSRRSTDPDLVSATPITHPNASLAFNNNNNQHVAHSRPRNRSPYSRTTPRSNSTGSAHMAEPMTRAHSLPARPTSSSSSSLSPALGSTSPSIRSPARTGSPFRPASPQGLHSANNNATAPAFYDGGFETISEHAELDLSQSTLERNISMNSLNSSRPVAARRQQRQSSPNRSPLTSSASSPALSAQRFGGNDSYPTLHHSGSMSSFASFSSMPSTPSSNRSRSPSISSLETIEDAPDLEWKAIEAERAAKLRAPAADTEGSGGDETPRRRGNSLDIPTRPTGFGFTKGQARKRWSVCGGEGRADLDLETIWEDQN